MYNTHKAYLQQLKLKTAHSKILTLRFSLCL